MLAAIADLLVGWGPDTALDQAARYINEGYLAVRLQSGVPGLASTYGVPKGSQPYEPQESQPRRRRMRGRWGRNYSER